MLRDLLKDGGLYTLSNFLTKGISLFLIPFYTTYFEPSDYGVIEVISVFGFFLTGILTLQLSQGLARFVAEPTISADDRILYASTSIWSAFIFMFLSFSILAIYPDWVMDILFDSGHDNTKIYYLALISIFLSALYYFLGVYFRFTRKTKLFSLLSMIHALFTIFFTWLLVYQFNLGIISIYIASLIVLPFLLIAQYFILRKEIVLKINFKYLKELLKYCLPIIPVSIALIVMNFTDRLFIKHYFDFNDLGIYGIGSKFASIIGIIIASFSMAISPLILQKHNMRSTKVELKEIFKIFVSIGMLAVLTLSLFSYETVDFFTTDAYQEAYTVMPLMYMSAVFVGAQMFAPGLMIEPQSFLMAIVTITFSCLNIALNYYLIPTYGLQGAAFATFLSILGQQSVFFYLSQKYYPFKVDVLKITIVVGTSFALIFFINSIQGTSYWVLFIVKISAIALYFLLLIKVKLLQVEKALAYIKNRIR